MQNMQNAILQRQSDNEDLTQQLDQRQAQVCGIVVAMTLSHTELLRDPRSTQQSIQTSTATRTCVWPMKCHPWFVTCGESEMRCGTS